MTHEQMDRFCSDVVRHRVLALSYDQIWEWAYFYARSFASAPKPFDTVSARQVATLLAADLPKTRDWRPPVAVLNPFKAA